MKMTKAVALIVMLAVAGAVGAQDLFRTDPPSLGGVVFPVFHSTAALYRNVKIVEHAQR